MESDEGEQKKLGVGLDLQKAMEGWAESMSVGHKQELAIRQEVNALLWAYCLGMRVYSKQVDHHAS